MKTIFIRVALPVLISAMLFSCEKKDNEPSDGSGNLKIGNQSYSLTSGTIWNYGEDDSFDENYEGYELSLSLYSNGLSENGWDNYVGSGLYLTCEIYSASRDAFVEEEYEFRSYILNSFPAGTFTYSGYGRFNDSDENDYSWNDITAGTITINKEGDTYTVSINCANASGEEVSGTYTGKLSYGYPPSE